MNYKKGENGQFQKTTGSTRYKTVQYKGRRIDEHCRKICELLGIDYIPRGLVVHHIDKNTHNNDIDNLALMTITAHNRIHSHIAWNKGETADKNEKIKSLVEKAQAKRKKTFMEGKFKETYFLRESGKTFIQIGKELGISRLTASARHKQYKEYINS